MDSELSETQKAVALDLIRSYRLGIRSVSDVLAAHRVSEDEYFSWITDGVFPSYTSSVAIRYAHADEPYVWAKLLELIEKGNVQAIKLYFDMRFKKGGQATSSAPSRELEELRSALFCEEVDEESE